MNLKKKIAILAVFLSASLFANGINNVSILVDQINNTKDSQIKNELKKKLELELVKINTDDLPKALEIVDSRLKK